MGSMASESQIPRKRPRKKKNVRDRIIDGGKKKFHGLAITNSAIDEILTGIDINNSIEDEGAYIESLKGYAGCHTWGKESAVNRFHVRDPDASYAKGRRMLDATNKDSKVDEVVFGMDLDVYNNDEAWLETDAFRGAFGGVSGKDFKEFGSSKRRYPHAPISKSVVDEVIYGVDLDASSGSKQQWIESMAGYAGVSSYDGVNAGSRFDGTETADSAEIVRRPGKKLWAGNPNKIATIDTVAFNHDIDGGEEELEIYKQQMGNGYAGRPCWDQHNFKDRFFPRDNDEPHKLGRRRYVNAPMAQTQQEVGARWSQVVQGRAGVPGHRCLDVMHGRYHKDRDGGDQSGRGYIPGRRKVTGHPCQNDSSFADLAFDCESEESSVHAGMPVVRIREVDVPEDATTHARAVFQPPPRRALEQAARRGEKSKQAVRAHTGEVADVIWGGTSAAGGSQPRRRKGRPKSSPGGRAAVGPKGPSIYDRDFRPMSTSDLLAAFEQVHAPDLSAPKRPGTAGELRGAFKSRTSQSTPASASVRQSSEAAQVRSTPALLRDTPRGTPRGSLQGTPRGSDRCSPHIAASSHGQGSVSKARRRGQLGSQPEPRSHQLLRYR
mmetsp:Transcript_158320/g.280696  ORF Transcript_158320/g.280696 Transcript_158320/m.280696 type:complete len:606 (-) Transcript_158320:72-1889(-)